jgi:retinol dehydrogenase-12
VSHRAPTTQVTTWFASNKYQFYVKGASKTKGNYAASKLACLAATVEMQKRLDAAFPENKAGLCTLTHSA